MSVIGSNILAGASGQGGDYTIARSLRFRSSATAYLNRTPASAGNRKTWTWSGWYKGSLFQGTDPTLFSSRVDGDNNTYLISYSASASQLSFRNEVSGVGSTLTTTAVYRDPSAWYHIVFSVDTTQATEANRVKIYVNGVLQPVTGAYPAQDANTMVNATNAHYVGSVNTSAAFLDGYMTEINLIDGQALTPSSFGANNASTGVWQPKKYAGTYGTNGFYLPFTDNSSATPTGLGKDFSGNTGTTVVGTTTSGSNSMTVVSLTGIAVGNTVSGLGIPSGTYVTAASVLTVTLSQNATSSNVSQNYTFSGNNWTTNNISLTAGSTYDSMTDVPTLTSATASNYCVLNPIYKLGSTVIASSYSTISNGNLTSTGNNTEAAGTIGVSSGKWYFEIVRTSGNPGDTNGIGVYLEGTSAEAIYRDDGNFRYDGSESAYGASWDTNGTVIGVALDLDNTSITFYKNGTSQGVAKSNLPSGTWIPLVYNRLTSTLDANFGQRPFTYTPPTGFVALNTFNLPTPTIGATASTQANKYFDATLYTGNGTTNTITNAGGFQPDFVWMKDRTNAYFHGLYDSVRGTGTSKSLYSNSTDAEGTNSTNQNLTSFNSNGFSLGSTSSTNAINANGDSYVAWQWQASNATAVTNTAGSITSTVSANTSAGFSVVTYTAQSSGTATMGHGLGVAPAMIIVKSRTVSPSGWNVYHRSLGATKVIYLNSNDAESTSSGNWNNTAPTSTVFTGGTGFANGGNMVAYCFSEVAGYSKFGSYTGNGSTDGTFVYTGFRPRYVMLKISNTAGDWITYDVARNTFNTTDRLLFPNTSGAEETSTSNLIDVLSNGFKLRGSSGGTNGSGNTYIYMAFAENPYKYSLAR